MIQACKPFLFGYLSTYTKHGPESKGMGTVRIYTSGKAHLTIFQAMTFSTTFHA